MAMEVLHFCLAPIVVKSKEGLVVIIATKDTCLFMELRI